MPFGLLSPFQVEVTYFRAQGGHLASIGSKDVHDFLAELETKVFLIYRLCLSTVVDPALSWHLFRFFMKWQKILTGLGGR